MNPTEEQLGDRLSATWRMPHGRGQIAAVEDVIRHADAQGFAGLRFAARMLATSAYSFGGEPGKAIVTFSWCLAAYDRGEGDRAFDHNLYWHFKWMAGALTRFPEVPLERTAAVLDDMERRYRLAGHTMNPVHQHRELVAQHVGDVATADEQYRLWCVAPRGEMSDCIACEPTSKLRYLSWRGRDEDAVALALPVLDGQVTCVEQPQAILTGLLLPYLRTGRLDEAAAAHRQAYRAIQTNRGLLGMLAEHVAFCAYTGNEARGLELIQRHLGWLDEAPTPLAEMYFRASAALVLGRLAAAGHADLPVRDTSVGVLHDALADGALALAQRFDARNGTSAQGKAIRDLLVAEPIVDHLPLSGPARKAHRRAVATAEPARYPDSPTELADLALRESRLHNDNTAKAIWARFDEVCNEPSGVLRASRLDARAGDLAPTDPPAAEDAWTTAAGLFADAGDEARRQAVLGRIGLLRCFTGDIADGLARITASVERLAEIGDDEHHARALTRLAVAYRLAGRAEDALTALERAGSLATATELLAQIAVDSADCAASLGDDHVAAGLAFALRGVELYETFGSSGALRLAQRTAGRLSAATGDLDRGFELSGAAALAEDPAVRGSALHLRGKMALDLNRNDDARLALTDAVADLIATGDDQQVAYARVDLSAACLNTGHPDDAADAAEEAVGELDRLGDANEAARARFLLAKAYRAVGQPDQALELLDRVSEHCAGQGNTAGVGQMNALAGEILDELDRDAEAAERFTVAADSYAAAELVLAEVSNRRRVAMSWWWADETDRATAALAIADERASQVVAEEPDAVWELAMLNYDGARILAGAQNPAGALDRIAAAGDGFRSLDATVEAAMADAMRGRLLIDLDRHDEAEKLLVAALEALPQDAARPRAELQDLLTQLSTR